MANPGDLNLLAAWLGIALGMAGGAVMGLFFQRDGWLGGYGSWRRRLVRLGHISFFGLAFVNLAFALSVERLGGDTPGLAWAGWLLIAGAALMPTVCLLSAWRKPLRHLFFLPVGTLIGGVAITVYTAITTLGALS